MKNFHPHQFRLSAIAIASTSALLAAFGPAHAQSDDLAAATKPDSSISVGVGSTDRDAPRFGQYTGLNEKQAYGLLDVDMNMRDQASGTWLRFKGRSLGLDSRSLRFEHNRQGSWGYFIDFSQTPRYEPFTVTTAVNGIGTSNLTIPTVANAGQAVQLKTHREALGLGFDTRIGGGWAMQVRFKSEEKDGSRVFARGTTGGTGLFEFAPEPINTTTRQLDVTLGYTSKQFQFTGGYYGTSFESSNKALTFTGGATGLASFTPMGLPPDNQSHQWHLSGGYEFSPTTRANFKVARGRITQTDAFILAPAAGVGRTDLGGQIDTTLAQAGLSARPSHKLSLSANVRYENRADKTPIARYFTGTTATSTNNGENEPRSIARTGGKLEASYQLPMAFRVIGAVDYEEVKRNSSAVRVVTHRDTTDETAYRLELRRSMSDMVTGALSLMHSKRGGSPYALTVLNNGTAGSNLIAPIHLADRERDKLRLSLNVTPSEALDLQLVLEDAKDSYAARDVMGIGPQQGRAQNYSLDLSYTISEKWQLTAFASRNDTSFDQTTAAGASAAQIWAAALRNRGDSYGLGVRGKPTAKIEWGADLSESDMRDVYEQTAITGTARVSLPEVSTKVTSLKMFAKYALQKNSGLRLDIVHERFRTDDWSWSSFTYTDGTRLTQNPNQRVTFVGVSYYYRWQ